MIQWEQDSLFLMVVSVAKQCFFSMLFQWHRGTQTSLLVPKICPSHLKQMDHTSTLQIHRMIACSKTYISVINYRKWWALIITQRIIAKVLLAPSVYPEAFGLMVTEAQLRGIPVVSTSICGLGEANQVPQTQVPDIPLVFDPSTLGSRCGNGMFFFFRFG